MPRGDIAKRTSVLLEEFLADMKLRGRTQRTVENYQSSLRKFFAQFPKTTPEKIGVDELRLFLGEIKDEQRLAGKTISRDFSALRSFFEYLEFEKKIPANPIPAFRKRYLTTIVRQARKPAETRDIVSVDDMKRILAGVADTRDRCLIAMLAKTGIRRQELVNLDTTDVDWKDQSVLLKPTPKRSNRRVYFDDEMARLLKSWLRVRAARQAPPDGPLFVSMRGTRLNHNVVYQVVTSAGAKAGKHNPGGTLKEKFGPHHLRHWFTTHLRRAGMTREDISELRGDVSRDTFDIYHHVDHEELRERYLAKIPQLNL